MTVEELIDILQKIKDKSIPVRHRVSEGEYGTEIVFGVSEEYVYIPIEPYNQKCIVIS